jgi:hypothetical protein
MGFFIVFIRGWLFLLPFPFGIGPVPPCRPAYRGDRVQGIQGGVFTDFRHEKLIAQSVIMYSIIQQMMMGIPGRTDGNR